MSKIDDVRKEMVVAMKAGDKARKETLSSLLAALKNKAIDKREDLTAEEEVQVVLKEIKQTKETLEMTPADRAEIIAECRARIAVLEEFAPKLSLIHIYSKEEQEKYHDKGRKRGVDTSCQRQRNTSVYKLGKRFFLLSYL